MVKFSRMVITRLPSVVNAELPAANIYLDDLEEILNILKSDGEDHAPILKFTVNDMTCDSIDDLRKIGGRTSVFEMEVWWEGARLHDALRVSPRFRAYLHVGGDSAQRRTWVMSQVSDLFRRRIDWKAKFRWLIISATGLLLLPILFVGSHFIDKMVGTKGELHWLLLLGLSVFLSYPVYQALALGTAERSTVILQSYSDEKGSWFQRHRDQITLAAVTSLISTIIGAAITLLVQRFLHQH